MIKIGPEGDSKQEGGVDPLFEKAVEVVIKDKSTAIAGLQRRLKISYARALQLIDRMEAEGIVSKMSQDGTNRRTILLEPENATSDVERSLTEAVNCALNATVVMNFFKIITAKKIQSDEQAARCKYGRVRACMRSHKGRALDN